jgi:prostaglandin-E synthase
VIWAQRKNCIFLTICLEDCKDPEIKMEPGSIYFKGRGGADGKEYETTLELCDKVEPTNSLYVVRPRNIEFCLKKEEDKFWPRLLKSNKKCPWLKIDFNKWKDEDDSEDEAAPGAPGVGGPGGDSNDFEEVIYL